MASVPMVYNVPLKKFLPDITITARVTGIRWWRVRLWLGYGIMWCGARVMGANFGRTDGDKQSTRDG